MIRRPHRLARTTALLLSALTLSACAETSPDPGALDPEPAGSVESLTGFDFGSAPWVFRPGGGSAETIRLDVVDGQAEQDTIQYVVGEPVYADVTGDGVADAAVPITARDGNGIDEQWYLWLATENGAQQLTLPIARTARCGTFTESVVAVDGGIQVHEFRRTIGEDALPCAQNGTDERTRVITAAPVGPNGVWWPVQTGPIGGFGGLCPTVAQYEGYPFTGELRVAPNPDAAEITSGRQVVVAELEPWPVYGEDFPGWTLVAVRTGDVFACAWAEVPTP